MKKQTHLTVMLRLVVLIRPLLLVMAGAVVLGVLGFLAAIFIPVTGTLALLAVLAGQPFIGFIAILAVLAGLRGILRYGEQYCNHFIAFSLLATIRDQVFRALRRLAPAKLEHKNSGALIALITGDIELLEVFYAHTISPLMIALITALVMVIFIAQINLALAAVAACAYLFIGVGLPLWLTKIRGQHGEGYRRQVGAVSTYLLDSLRGMKELLMFNQGWARQQELTRQGEILNRQSAEIKRFDSWGKVLSDASIYGWILLMLFIAFVLKQNGAIDFGQLLVATVTMASSFGPVIALSNLSGGLVPTLESGRRVLELLDEAPAVNEVTAGVDVTQADIAFDKVSFRYNQQQVLNQLNFRLQPGESLSITGRSGSGKSTVLKLIMRFWDVRSGSIEIGNQAITGINTKSLRALEGYLTQDTFLFQTTILENVLLAHPAATEAMVITACKQAAIHDFIISLPQGYQTNVGELGEHLSSGQRQRIGLARIFLHQSDILLLDEPTSNLDVLNEKQILQSLQAHTAGKTLILVSHKTTTHGITARTLELEQ